MPFAASDNVGRLHFLQWYRYHFALATSPAALQKDQAFQASSPKTFKRPSFGAAFFLLVVPALEPVPWLASAQADDKFEKPVGDDEPDED
ncbi:hypothetical protein [Sphingomonas sp. UNC305MFCol5.2]|uniref:hypothetical protein n=1 Tax=Sphingomonas sp. UNC305MFCol5.2 TaxID=1449076 RepID=UPI0012DED535|nr:hypothetical protein [Sphingomonas sp. UNC305MFCol5.2]